MVFVGLGNPGKQYEKTRHNIGFEVLRAFAALLELTFGEEKRFQSEVAKGVISDEQSSQTVAHLVMPLTYMNHSGRAVRRYLDFYKLDAQHLVVIVDDVALPLGKVRLRKSGRSGGHRGLESVEVHVGSQNYTRLRIGVGEPSKEQRVREGGEALSNYVLSKFTKEEQKNLEPLLADCAEVLLKLLKDDPTGVINEINQNKPFSLGVGEQ